MSRVIAFILMLFVASNACAGVLEEFNGVKWGVKLNGSRFKLVNKFEDMRSYSKIKHDDLYGIPVTEVIYTVNKGTFNAAHAVFEESSYKMIRQFLVSKYGQPVDAAGKELFVVRSNGKTARAMLQHGLVNFSFQRN